MVFKMVQFTICAKCGCKITIGSIPRTEIIISENRLKLDYEFLCGTCTKQLTEWLKKGQKQPKLSDNWKCLDCGCQIENLNKGDFCPHCKEIRSK